MGRLERLTATPVGRAAGRRLTAGTACVAVVVGVLGGCGGESPPSEATAAGRAGPGGVGSDAAPRPATAADVRAGGTSACGGGAVVLSPGGTPRTEPTGSGAERWTWAVAGGDGAAGAEDAEGAEGTEGMLVALVAAPSDGTVELQADGSVVVRGTDGSVVCGLAPVTGGVAEVLAPDLVGIEPSGGTVADDDVAVWFGSVGTESATWGENEGGRSLAVVPTAWARAAGTAGITVVWQELTRLAPAEATDGMRDQLVCHALGAPDKASWNLEPWRPDVGLLGVLAAQCNPE